MRTIFIILFFGQLSCCIANEKIPVDISFIVVDLKYNKSMGVQICEIQQGAHSVFTGYDFLHNEKNLTARKFLHALSCYHQKAWVVLSAFIDSGFKEVFVQKGYQHAQDENKLFEETDFNLKASQAPPDPYDISSYQGIFIGDITKIAPSYTDFRILYPGVIPIDIPFYPFKQNKAAMNNLLRTHEKLAQYKPRCGIYRKDISSSTIQKIQEDIKSPLLVIKPIGLFKGIGVIILEKDDLKAALEYIFSNSKKLKNDPDPSYRWWGIDQEEHFLVEEFIPSDTIYVPHLNNLPYDPTLRAAILLVYHNKGIDCHIIECHWKLPKSSLADTASLNEKHKSYASSPHFAAVAKETKIIIEAELNYIMRTLYKSLLRSVSTSAG